MVHYPEARRGQVGVLGDRADQSPRARARLSSKGTGKGEGNERRKGKSKKGKGEIKICKAHMNGKCKHANACHHFRPTPCKFSQNACRYDEATCQFAHLSKRSLHRWDYGHQARAPNRVQGLRELLRGGQIRTERRRRKRSVETKRKRREVLAHREAPKRRKHSR